MPSADILCIGTHHKTGTKWLRGALGRISRRCEIPLHYRPSADDAWVDRITQRPALVFSGSAQFPARLRHDPKCHVVRMIRDPRDILISGMRYHMSADDRHEKFLYRRQDELGGKSYQEHLNALGTYEERLLFEMDHKHHHTISEIMTRDVSATSFEQWRYEDLIADEECLLFNAAVDRLDISDKQKRRAAKIFWRNSLFGGGAARSVKTHVKSGAARQWQKLLPPSVAEVYRDKYGNALIELGYETDKNWLDKLVGEPV